MDNTPEHDDDTPMPEYLQRFADVTLMYVREQLAKRHGKQFAPLFVMVRHPSEMQVLPVPMDDDGRKSESAIVMRYAATQFKADAVFLISEVWGLPPALRNDPKAALAAHKKYGSVSAIPGCVEQLMISVEANEGSWLGVADLTGAGLARRCADMTFRSRAVGQATGRFDNLFDKPERRRARAQVMERFAAKMQEAGLDPHAPRDGAPLGAYDALERVLCGQGAPMPDDVIDTFVSRLVEDEKQQQKQKEAPRAPRGH